MDTLTELSLFSGYGGFSLGLKLAGRLLGFEVRTVGYVEIERYCQEILQARIRDGWLDDAPIWDDVHTFDGEPWRGVVDIVTAGFPCQPFSHAGKRKGGLDDRNLWPQTVRVIRAVRPRLVLLENVSGLLSVRRRGRYYVQEIFRHLAESGYDAVWKSIPASDAGAPHKRLRWFCLAHASDDHGRTRVSRAQEGIRQEEQRRRGPDDRGMELADAAGQHDDMGRPRTGPVCGKRSKAPGLCGRELWPALYGAEQYGWEPPRLVDNPLRGRHVASKGTICARRDSTVDAGNRPTESGLGVLPHGRPGRVGELRALGNGIVPSQLALALVELLDG